MVSADDSESEELLAHPGTPDAARDMDVRRSPRGRELRRVVAAVRCPERERADLISAGAHFMAIEGVSHVDVIEPGPDSGTPDPPVRLNDGVVHPLLVARSHG